MELLKREMDNCTFHPHINKKSIDLIDSAKKRKQDKAKVKVEQAPIFPMKPQVVRNKPEHKASMFFEFHNKQNQDLLVPKQLKMAARKRASRRNNADLADVPKTFTKSPTPQFNDSEDELPLRLEDDSGEEDEEEIDQLVRQVIFENDDTKNTFSRDPNPNGEERYSSPTFPRGEI